MSLIFSDSVHLEEMTIDEKGTKVLQRPEPKDQNLETDMLDLGKQ